MIKQPDITKGWVANQDSRRDMAWNWFVSDENGDDIADIFHDGRFNEFNECEFSEVHARFISAAPNLMKALIELYTHCVPMEIDGVEFDGKLLMAEKDLEKAGCEFNGEKG